ncbi:MAG: hypothetical protein KatS3mg057_3218 [Herpetosiphonaceae bacterium]|nr:MAG: hypothetical protein KatS3mg057_3218 [Herpetosiphonaceae bacterium]
MSKRTSGEGPRCPFCGSQDVELHALFGSLMLMSQYYCNGCRTVFEHIRDDEPPAFPQER